MARKTRLKAIRFALEANYGIDAIAAAEPIVDLLGQNFSVTPLAGDDIELNYDDGKLGSRKALLSNTHVQISFAVDLAGAGAAATQPAYSALLQGCLRQAQEAADKVEYPIQSAGTASLSFYFFYDGTLHALVGARGTFKLVAKAGELPKLEFTFTGLFVPPTAQALPALDFSAWQQPREVGAANSAFVLDGQSRKLISLEYDAANEVIYQQYVGHEEVLITDFKPTCTLEFEAPPHADFDAVAIALAEGEHSFELSHGNAAGNTVLFGSSKVQFGRPEYGDKDGTLTLRLPLRMIGENDLLTTQ